MGWTQVTMEQVTQREQRLLVWNGGLALFLERGHQWQVPPILSLGHQYVVTKLHLPQKGDQAFSSITVHIDKVKGGVWCSRKGNLLPESHHFVICVSCSHSPSTICSISPWISLGHSPSKRSDKSCGPTSRRKKKNMYTFPHIFVSLKSDHGPEVKNLWSSLPLYRKGKRPKEGRGHAQGHLVSLQED